MVTSSQIDVLNEFSKEEIIAWLRERGPLLIHAKRSDLLVIRWRRASEKLLADYDSELARWKAEKPDFAKRDALAAQCNATTDIDEKLRLLAAIEPYDRAMHDHFSRTAKLDKRQKAVDRMHQEALLSLRGGND